MGVEPSSHVPFRHQRSHTVLSATWFGLTVFGIGFAPMSFLFSETLLPGVIFDLIMSVVLWIVYKDLAKNDFLFKACTLPLSIPYLFTGMDPFILTWVLKIYPVVQIYRYEILHVKHKFMQSYQAVAGLTLVLLFVHVLACLWLVVEPSDHTLSYTDYNKAYYWVITTLTTVGYGDITPSSNLSRVYTSIVMMLGVGVYGVVISQMSRFIFREDVRNRINKEKLESLNSFFKHYHIPENLRVETRLFFDHVLSRKSHEQEKELLKELPTRLRHDLQTYMILRPISETKLFKGCEHRDLKDVLPFLENEDFGPGESIFVRGDPGDAMFIIAHGHVEISLRGQSIAELGPNQVFGEMSLVFGETRNADAVATSYVDLFKLSKENFHRLSESHPTIAKNVNEIIRQRQK